MTTRWCPRCRAEYVAGVAVCADCDVELVDEAPSTGGSVEADGDQLGYELGEWSTEARVLLERLLVGKGVLHTWETATLVVRADDEAHVDSLLAQVEATEDPVLDPDEPQLVYEMEGLAEAQRAQIADALTTEGVAHGWDDVDDLVVYERDEQRVEEILDDVEYPDALPPDEGDGDDDGGDGLVAQYTLSKLFLAGDRLMRDARDHQGVLALVAAADTVESLAVPYGFAPGVWTDLVALAVALRSALEDPDTVDEDLSEQATALRAALRQYV
ncbi:hypothetical protein BH24ACT3_BH24ACT3_08970 [soil metagenome]